MCIRDRIFIAEYDKQKIVILKVLALFMTTNPKIDDFPQHCPTAQNNGFLTFREDHSVKWPVELDVHSHMRLLALHL